MDFLKACATNVQCIPGLPKTRFVVYQPSASHRVESAPNPFHGALAELRQRNVLCWSYDDELWVFSSLTLELQAILEGPRYRFRIADEGTIEQQPDKRTAEGKLIIHGLLDAVEAGLSFRLARESGFVKIGSWSWWLHPSYGEDEGVLVQMQVRYLETGTLYTATTTQNVPFVALGEISDRSGLRVILAPSGLEAKVSETTGQDSIHATWKAAVELGLAAEGLIVRAGVEWATVLLGEESGKNIQWPCHLCFVEPAAPQPQELADGGSWKTWFDVGYNDFFQDPMAFAETWFKTSTDRERMLQDTAALNQLSENSENPELAANAANAGPDFATSPPFANRPDLQSMNGIYPTPPDGLIHMANAQQPVSSDTALTAHVQADISSFGGETYRNVEEANAATDIRGRGPSITSSVGLHTYQPNSDDLFGDMDRDFAGGEVGDDDFNFFDEPDEVSATVGIQDADMMDEALPSLPEELVPVQRFDEFPPALSADPQPGKDQLTDSGSLQAQASEDYQQTYTPDAPVSKDTFAIAETPFTAQLEPEKPLSPFSIRERLLPPPIPASVMQTSTESQQSRRQSIFSPLAFADNPFGSKYRSTPQEMDTTLARVIQPPSMSLSMKNPKRGDVYKNAVDDAVYSDSEIEDDSFESSQSEAERELPPKPPWDNKKRKRGLSDAPVMSFSLMPIDSSISEGGEISEVELQDQLRRVLSSSSTCPIVGASQGSQSLLPGATAASGHEKTFSTQDLLGRKPQGIAMVAQLVAEQSSTSTDSIARDLDTLGMCSSSEDSSGHRSALQDLVFDQLSQLLPDSKTCEISSLALPKETTPRPPTNAPKGQPRPLQRPDSVATGPDVFSIPAPHLRLQRAESTVEMLPPVTHFWDAVALSPISGPKDIRAFAVLPALEDLNEMMVELLEDLKAVYEGCKLGSHIQGRPSSSDSEDSTSLWPVRLDEDMPLDFETAVRAYMSTCCALGEALSRYAHSEPERTIVVYLVNPFTDNEAAQHLCACFLQLYGAYRDHPSKAGKQQAHSDIVLQILPIALFASRDTLVMPNTAHLATLAREVYDRCPPPTDLDHASQLPIVAAPCIELATSIPKRVQFTLTPEPPTDLLHDNSILHLAYAISKDGHWLGAAWIDSTGRYQQTMAFCIRGTSFAEVAEEIWIRTVDIMSTRHVAWRVFIATAQHTDLSKSNCWRDLVSAPPFRQPTTVTLVTLEQDTALRLVPPAAVGENAATGNPTGAGFLTPVSTPQGTSLTVSPDATGYTNAPPTPAPSESAENDPDAHLVNLNDETWGMLLDPGVGAALQRSSPGSISVVPSARGALIKRSDASATGQEQLPVLGVDVLWALRVKPDSKEVEDGLPRQAEVTLKEVLGMYRNLALLAKVRGVDGKGWEGMPLHVVCAGRAVEGLEGF